MSIKCVFVLLSLIFSQMVLAELTKEEATKLNQVMGKTLSSKEWDSLERLHLDSLPKEQFPESFDKLAKLSIIDLLPAKSYEACTESTLKNSSSFFEQRSETNKKLHELYKNKTICLSGRSFEIEDRIGAGDKAVVYRIKDAQSHDTYAFTRFNTEYGLSTNGGFLVLARARKSQSRINMPLLVNKKEQYLISPLMTGWVALSDSFDHTQWRPKGDCELLMREDGIFGGWDAHAKNYMYPTSQSTLLKAIDLRTFMRLEKATTQMLDPQYSQKQGDPSKCVVQ